MDKIVESCPAHKLTISVIRNSKPLDVDVITEEDLRYQNQTLPTSSCGTATWRGGSSQARQALFCARFPPAPLIA